MLSLILLILAAPGTDSTTCIPEISRIEALADTLYALGEFDAAALEYKRLIYYASQSQDTSPFSDTLPGSPQRLEETMWNIKLALSLYRNGELNEADSILYSLEGPMVRMVRAVLLIEEGNPYLAALAIDSATLEAFGVQAYRLRGWAYFQANDFWNAARQFGAAGDASLDSVVGELSSIRLKNPRTARWLSLIPGLGEAYAGKLLFGLWALTVNTGDTYLIVNALLEQRYLDALLLYTFLWQRFYAGSMSNASRFAHEWNERKLAEAMNPIREEFGQKRNLSLDLEALNDLYRISVNPE